MGVDPNKEDSRGFTPMGIAAALGQVEAMRALVAMGADPNKAMEGRGQSPIYIAAAKGQVEAVRALIGAGAELDDDALDVAMVPQRAGGALPC